MDQAINRIISPIAHTNATQIDIHGCKVRRCSNCFYN